MGPELDVSGVHWKFILCWKTLEKGKFNDVDRTIYLGMTYITFLPILDAMIVAHYADVTLSEVILRTSLMISIPLIRNKEINAIDADVNSRTMEKLWFGLNFLSKLRASKKRA